MQRPLGTLHFLLHLCQGPQCPSGAGSQGRGYSCHPCRLPWVSSRCCSSRPGWLYLLTPPWGSLGHRLSSPSPSCSWAVPGQLVPAPGATEDMAWNPSCLYRWIWRERHVPQENVSVHPWQAQEDSMPGHENWEPLHHTYMSQNQPKLVRLCIWPLKLPPSAFEI